VDFFVQWMGPLEKFLLLLCRTGSFLALTPLLRRLPVPRLAAVGLVLFTTIVLDSAGYGPAQSYGAGAQLVTVAAVELGIGVALGLVTLIIFEGFRLAGYLVGLSMGMAAATLLDPAEKTQSSALAAAYALIAAVIFVMLDGHHMLLRALVLSYELAPVGAAHFPTATGDTLVSLLAASFTLGVRIAAPVLAAQMLIDMTAGILGRSIPRMPIFFISLPAKMLLSYGIAAATLPLLSVVLDQQMLVLERHLLRVLHGM